MHVMLIDERYGVYVLHGRRHHRSGAL